MITPSLNIPSALFGSIPSDHVRADTVSELRNAPIGGHNSGRAFMLTRSNGEMRRVSTINELRAAEHEGFFAASNHDMRAWSYFKRVDDLLAAVSLARASRVSFLTPIAQIDLLPARLAPLELNPQDSETRTPPHEFPGTIGDMVREGRCKVEERDNGQLLVRAGVETTLEEVMRGDLNGDGVEDALIWQFHRIDGGTMHWSNTLALTRTNENALFSIIRLPTDDAHSGSGQTPRC